MYGGKMLCCVDISANVIYKVFEISLVKLNYFENYENANKHNKTHYINHTCALHRYAYKFDISDL